MFFGSIVAKQNQFPTKGRGFVEMGIRGMLEKQFSVIILEEITLPTPVVLGFLFRKSVAIKPVVSRDDKVLQLTFKGNSVETKQAPEG